MSASRTASSSSTRPTARRAACGPTAQPPGFPTAAATASSPTTSRPASASPSATSHSPTATATPAASGLATRRCGCSTAARTSLFAYDLGSGAVLDEYELASGNGDPHGVWSDGVTVWVSDHGAKRLFAYRLPEAPEAVAAEDAEPQTLERVIDEEFKELSKASNNSPRGLWSDGDVMYVADESDARVYSYNMPNAIDARLASLSLSGVDIGEFSPNDEEYEGAADEGVTQTTVTAEALQRRTSVDIDPLDADVAAEGHQVALEDLAEVTVTVTSADGSRKKTYRVRLAAEEVAEPVPDEVAEPASEETAGSTPEEAAEPTSCLRGDIAVGLQPRRLRGGQRR